MERGVPGWENWVKALGWEKIVISECEARKDLEGVSLQEISFRMGVRPCQALFELLLEARGTATMLLFGIGEEDLRRALKSPLSCIASDSWVNAPRGGGKPHPRGYGTFPRFLMHSVRGNGDLSWEEAVRKITSLPAAIAGIEGRGRIGEGFWADLVVLDPETVGDRATFQEPHQYPEGIRHVLVNGEFVVKEGAPTGLRPGRILKRG
jgi:N-acyl-D-aspartate/D-glutamate deacylase